MSIGDKPSTVSEESLRFPSPIPVEEVSMEDPEPTAVQDRILNFKIVVGGSIAGKDSLLDGLGYRYGKKHKEPRKNGSMIWRCTQRKIKDQRRCTATVRQLGDQFTLGPTNHTHGPKVKDMALSNHLVSTLKMAENVCAAAHIANPDEILPSVFNIVRSATRKRAESRTPHPVDLFLL